MITFQCNAGLIPEGEMTAFCNSSGFWSPDPTAVNCRKVEGRPIILICSTINVIDQIQYCYLVQNVFALEI